MINKEKLIIIFIALYILKRYLSLFIIFNIIVLILTVFICRYILLFVFNLIKYYININDGYNLYLNIDLF